MSHAIHPRVCDEAPPSGAVGWWCTVKGAPRASGRLFEAQLWMQARDAAAAHFGEPREKIEAERVP